MESQQKISTCFWIFLLSEGISGLIIFSFFVFNFEGIIFSIIISVISLIMLFISLFNIKIIKSRNRNHYLGMTIVYLVSAILFLLDFLVNPLKYSPGLLFIIFFFALGLFELYKFIFLEKLNQQK